MAGFQEHITVSSVLGGAYAAYGYGQGAPWETAALGGVLCSVAGMLPDLDSDSGVPCREMFSFSAAVIPALMIDRFQHMGWKNELIAVATAGIYLFVRFGVKALFKHFSVHRGMWHSVPACCTAGLLTFLICDQQNISLRIYLAVAIMLGFFSHLLLDEIWSVNMSPTKLGLKSSWGTALKFWGDVPWANFFSYVLLLVCAAAALGDPMLMQQFGYRVPYNTQQVEENSRDFIQHRLDNARHWLQPKEPQQPNYPWR
jgi:hypothetical protein